MNATRWIRYALVAAALICGLTAVVLAGAVESAHEAAARITRHETAWGGANSRVEVLTLARHAADFAATGDPAAREQTMLFYDIVSGRLDSLLESAFGAFVTDSPARLAIYEDLKRIIEELRAPLFQLPDRQAWVDVRGKIDTALKLVSRIASEAKSHSLAAATELSNDLDSKHDLQYLALMALSVSALMLIVLLEFQNRILSRTHNQMRQSRDQFAHLAHHDPLTGLPNRAAVTETIERLVEGASGRAPFALAVLDLDGFKPVNDTLGHVVGDAILRSVAERLRGAVRGCDIVSRFGGDEFVIAMPELSSPADAGVLVHQIVQVLREPLEALGHVLVVGASVGFAVSKGDAEHDRNLLHFADIALNHAKGQGRGTSCMFKDEMLHELQLRGKLERDLAVAIRSGDLLPFYQPQVDAHTGQIVGVEALARWLHPVLGSVPPSQFIPVAEATGQISELGLAVLEAACRDAGRFPEHIHVSVNVSPAQLAHSSFPEQVRRILAEHGVSPHRLQLEITESAVMRDAARAREAIMRLKTLGVSVSLDDFGTGHSSLSYLRDFGLHEVKIDRSFIKSLDAEGETIIRAVVLIARRLRLTVVAEGVETQQQATTLRRLGCDRLQGYYFGRPEKAEELIRRLAAEQEAAAVA